MNAVAVKMTTIKIHKAMINIYVCIIYIYVWFQKTTKMTERKKPL